MRLDVGKKNALRFRVGMLLAFGLIWTGAVLGGGQRFLGVLPYDIPHRVVGVGIADFNGDQVVDLVEGNASADQEEPAIVSVLLGVRDGTPAAPVHYWPGQWVRDIVVGDLNGDELPDLAVSNAREISVMLGIGDGTFAAPVGLQVIEDAVRFTSLAIGDLDGDQALDLVLTEAHNDAELFVLLGLGDGTFADAVSYDWPVGNLDFVTIGDLSGDEVPDLVVMGNSNENVSVLLGVGDGTFAAAAHYNVGEWPVFVAIGDLNGDQRPDLAVADYKGGTNAIARISVLLGVGDGTFSAAVHYALDGGRGNVAIGDLDGDQFPDLAARNGILLGVGDGTFGALVPYPAGVSTAGIYRTVAIADLNGDQLPDVALAEDTTVSVLLNQSTSDNRYLTFNPVEPGPVAFKLDMVSSLFHPTATVSGWIGVPDANGIAALEPTPVTREWTEPVVHVTGCEITPVAEFELRASADWGATFSPPVALQTTPQPGGGKFWGDIVGTFNGFFWEVANGVTNIDDGLAVIHTFVVNPGAPELPRSDVHPQEPNRVVNINDVLFVIFAFQGDPYPFGCPNDPCRDNIANPCP